MKFLNDWVTLGLAFGLVFGGAVVGRRLGSFAAIWLAGAVCLTFRLADAIWKPGVAELHRFAPGIESADTVSLTWVLLFLGPLVPVVALVLVLQPGKHAPLPRAAEAAAGVIAGLVAGIVLLAGLVQSQAFNPEVRANMPYTWRWAQPALEAAGQTHTKPADPKK
ncbi:hypothetical protein OPIT5_09800 [Opitutaceae bacterium TAV5]|nr:hypothetical protein OPIT5_09800 [Opitutaceae bacterium TAV5]